MNRHGYNYKYRKLLKYDFKLSFFYHLKLFRLMLRILVIITFCEYGLFFWFHQRFAKTFQCIKTPCTFVKLLQKECFDIAYTQRIKKKSQCRDETLNYCNKTFVNIVRLLPSKVVLWHLKDIDICVVCRSFLSLLYFAV